jgi:pimeloyl-ACP methyl ester carboxylesterase
LAEEQNAMRVWGVLALIGCLLGAGGAKSGDAPLGIALEGLAYPYAVEFLNVVLEGQELRLAYMDVAPTTAANGQSVLLLHGRNFPASYWKTTIAALAEMGYRVVAPDQLGFGKSSKPTFDYHFDTMARTTAMLLQELMIPKVNIVAHSMGGMLAVRFSRMYPQRVDRLILESPIGLEDYRLYVPPVETEQLIEQERNLSADSYRDQLVANYSLSLAIVEPFVQIRERLKDSGEYPRWLRSFVNSFQMIYREPVVGEIPLIGHHTVFIMGENDRNAPGRQFAAPELRSRMGRNVELAKDLAARMASAQVDVFSGTGHVAHLEAGQRFNGALLRFLSDGR